MREASEQQAENLLSEALDMFRCFKDAKLISVKLFLFMLCMAASIEISTIVDAVMISLERQINSFY